mmetsp:Transcript_5740/g.17056  ORF Transcript_5740/g.17056 Transcript_5740/m.17056 type:complete len:209 (+) Transcript_5740:397-1023(+)
MTGVGQERWRFWWYHSWSVVAVVVVAVVVVAAFLPRPVPAFGLGHSHPKQVLPVASAGARSNRDRGRCPDSESIEGTPAAVASPGSCRSVVVVVVVAIHRAAIAVAVASAPASSEPVLAASMAVPPTRLQLGISLQLHALELQLLAPVVAKAALAQIVVVDVDGVESPSDDGRAATAVAGVPPVDESFRSFCIIGRSRCWRQLSSGRW